jgi:large subunit ribosomal protein L4e
MNGRTADILGMDGKKMREVTLPDVFHTPFRPDLIKRAVIAAQSRRFQPKGRNPMAGKRTTAESFGVGRNLARVPRVKGERHPRASMAAFAPSTVKGRVTHPIRVEKTLLKDLNAKERKLAMQSAIAATAMKEIVKGRGHVLPETTILPLIVSDDVQALNKTSAVRDVMRSLGVWEDVVRVTNSRKARGSQRHRRGKGKRQAIGPLIVVSDDKGLGKAANNIPGTDVASVNSLGTEMLAPGTHAGRLTIWSESALKVLAK